MYLLIDIFLNPKIYIIWDLAFYYLLLKVMMILFTSSSPSTQKNALLTSLGSLSLIKITFFKLLVILRV